MKSRWRQFWAGLETPQSSPCSRLLFALPRPRPSSRSKVEDTVLAFSSAHPAAEKQQTGGQQLNLQKLPHTLPILTHGPKLGLMATPSCKGSWGKKLPVFCTAVNSAPSGSNICNYTR